MFPGMSSKIKKTMSAFTRISSPVIFLFQILICALMAGYGLFLLAVDEQYAPFL